MSRMTSLNQRVFSIEKAATITQMVAIALICVFGLTKFAITVLAILFLNLIICSLNKIINQVFQDHSKYKIAITKACTQISVALYSPFIFMAYGFIFVDLFHTIRFIQLFQLYQAEPQEFEIPFVYAFILQDEEQWAYLADLRSDWATSYQNAFIGKTFMMIKTILYVLVTVVKEFFR